MSSRSPATFNIALEETQKKVGSQRTHQPQGKNPYLDEHAKTYITPGTGYCGEYAKVGNCDCGKQYVKVIFCGKEWCENCREITHNRRIARWLPKAVTMQSFGYFVFTIPVEMREFFKDKKKLSELRTYLRRRLKQIYPDIKALCRWHFFGENPYFFHPHFNVIVDSFEKLPKEELKKIKQDYKSALERLTGVELDKKVSVYYHYCSCEGFKRQYARKHKILTDEQAQELYNRALFHKLRYITRPTFTVYNQELAKKLKNFRNSSIWGKFPELSYEEVEAMAKRREAYCDVSKDLTLLESGHCPKCGGRIRWLPGLFPGTLSSKGKEIGNGYFESLVKIRGSPPLQLPSREKLKELRSYRGLLRLQSENLWNWLEDWEKQEKQRADIHG